MCLKHAFCYLFEVKKSILVSENRAGENFLSFTCPYSQMCIRIYIFNFKKQRNEQKNKENEKKKKKLKKKNIYIRKTN